MYSVVLMTALTVGGTAPEAGCYGWRGCGGCYCGGCWGGCGGYYGYGGCYGGYGWGGCYGGWGCAGYITCHGCYGCVCYGCASTGQAAGYIAPATPVAPAPAAPAAPALEAPASYHHGGVICTPVMPPAGAPAGRRPVQPMPPAPDAPPAGQPEPVPPPKKADDKEVSAKARLIVEVPADTRLYIDDQLMKSTAKTRAFTTPPLAPGQTYYYDVRVEVPRNGHTYVETRRVIVRAGEVVRENFEKLEPEVAAGPVSTVGSH